MLDLVHQTRAILREAIDIELVTGFDAVYLPIRMTICVQIYSDSSIRNVTFVVS
jgi:hypothetical protein